MKALFPLLLCAALLCGCGAQTPAGETAATGHAEPVDMTALYTRLEAMDMPEMVELDEGLRLDLYGIRSEDVKQVKVMICTDGLRADEFWLIEAVDEAAAQKLKGLAENRVKQKDAESITYSPEQNVIVKKSVVETVGRYVYFICSPDVEAMTDIVRTALGQ